MMCYAHSVSNRPVHEWQSLEEHSFEVARMASCFADQFKSAEIARLIGLVHDAGKSRKSFQDYLLRQNGIEPEDADVGDHSHSGVGAAWLANRWQDGRFRELGILPAYCVAGHHAGLPDWQDGVAPNGALKVRLADDVATLAEAPVAAWICRNESEWKSLRLNPSWKWSDKNTDLSLWIRMLYSCLTDADFLDTECFFDAGKYLTRGKYPAIAELASVFFEKLNAKQSASPKTDVNLLRAKIRADAERAAHLEPGLFSLTVPTGGGKTLSAMAFALRHAMEHGLDRVVYVIPYTSIIEQTADVLRSFFGDDAVVEHHSNLDPDKETPESRLACENWDAPIIVTTAVQFFESLYSCKSSRCRKLHNLVRSVVILDEVQLLPPNLLWPCTEVLAQLVMHYGTSIVLSTATQPELSSAGPLKDLPVRAIVSDEESLYDGLKRVRIELPGDIRQPQSWDAIAEDLRQHPQVLCIVNGKRDCAELVRRLPGAIYLTTNLCGEHRSQRIAEIKKLLARGEEVRVVSTQLIEAGVDVDFPVVYRAYTGYSSIVQAAGRCNREGLQRKLGRMVVFMPPKPSSIGLLRKAEDAMTEMLALGPVSFDDPSASRRFFEHFYERQNDNGEKTFRRLLVDGARYCHFQFREADAAFRMIEDNTVPVIVRYGEGESLIARYRAIGHPVRELMRKLQRFTVAVYRTRLPELLEKGFVEELPPQGSGIYAQTMPSLYSDVYGFEQDREGLDAEDCIV